MANAKAAEMMRKAKEMIEKAKKLEEADALVVGQHVMKLRERNYEGIADFEQLKSEIEKVLS